jgi:protein-S-isoprenylcysteine O-methyltransferase Ste14
MSQRSRVLGHIRLVLVYLFVAGLVLFARPTLPLLVIGAILALAGEALRLWSAGHLHKSVQLCTSGPFAHTQNPLYLGRLLILTGLAIAARHEYYLNLLALAAGYAVFFLYYMPRKLRIEGQRLANLHGPAFEAYHRGVPILFPSLRPYPGQRTPWSFHQMVHNQEPLVLAGVLLVIAVLLWKTTHV